MNYSTDDEIEAAVLACLKTLNEKPLNTLDKMTACYNLTSRVLRLFFCASREDVNGMIDEMAFNLKRDFAEFTEDVSNDCDENAK